jgi:hypothetical protein
MLTKRWFLHYFVQNKVEIVLFPIRAWKAEEAMIISSRDLATLSKSFRG